MAQTVGDITTGSHVKSLRNPIQGHGCFAAKAAGDLHFVAVAFAPSFQFRLPPSPLPQFLRDHALGFGHRRFMALNAPVMLAHSAAHLLQQLFPKRCIAQTPAAPEGFQRLWFRRSPALFHQLLKVSPPGCAVLGDTHVAEESAHFQPRWSPCGAFQVVSVAAPAILPQPLLLVQQPGTNRI
jgi:hypothetical protein